MESRLLRAVNSAVVSTFRAHCKQPRRYAGVHRPLQALRLFDYPAVLASAVLNVIPLVVQAVLLSVYIRSINRESASTAKVQFGRNYDHMTLDHEYDALWQGKAIESGGYIVLNKHSSRYTDREYGAISM
jgi:hypothetical protein